MKNVILFLIAIGTTSSVMAQQCNDQAELKIESRALFKDHLNRWQTGNIKEIYSNNTVKIKDDHLRLVYKNIEEISLAVPCKHEVKSEQHVLFPVKDGYFTGHVREVFANGMARIIDDHKKPVFSETTKLGVSVKHATFVKKGQQVLFKYLDGQDSDGEVKEVFSSQKVVIADNHSGKRFVRRFDQIAPAQPK